MYINLLTVNMLRKKKLKIGAIFCVCRGVTVNKKSFKNTSDCLMRCCTLYEYYTVGRIGVQYVDLCNLNFPVVVGGGIWMTYKKIFHTT